MQSRRLSPEERDELNALLGEFRDGLEKFAAGDAELLFAGRRRIIVKLGHDERGTPTHRNKLKDHKWADQSGLCAICGTELARPYAELDRFKASDGYTVSNTRLIHHECHIKDQAEKRYK